MRGSFRHAAKPALDVALPTLRVARREPVAGEGRLRRMLVKAVVHRQAPFARSLAPPLSTIPAPSYFSMRQSLVPPAYTRACAAMRYDEVAKTLVLH